MIRLAFAALVALACTDPASDDVHDVGQRVDDMADKVEDLKRDVEELVRQRQKQTKTDRRTPDASISRRP